MTLLTRCRKNMNKTPERRRMIAVMKQRKHKKLLKERKHTVEPMQGLVKDI
ncbi:MAG: hypothetical protein Q8R76_01270 [Candidatus Omnitrophota bacterium]|nr:hypothetical protein [Candidatus Omnitrophota bacterium]